MKKIMLLMPCLMLDTNRKKNIEAQTYMLKNYKGIDEYVVYDQCYTEKVKLKEIAEIESKKHGSKLNTDTKNVYRIERIKDESLKNLKPYKKRSK